MGDATKLPSDGFYWARVFGAPEIVEIDAGQVWAFGHDNPVDPKDVEIVSRIDQPKALGGKPKRNR